ncbi:MAG TPA: hypothetical protein DEG43_09350 [Acidimicrobiaceae bacterium]|jgi:tight adherence protein C|nr:hypothetical protein [Acidimicrobiaceae bacterium]
MTQLLALSSLALWVGSTLIFSELRWFRTPRLVERLQPYVDGGLASRARRSVLSAASLSEVLTPLVRSVGDRFAQLLGLSDNLDDQLIRSGSPLSASTFRLRQAAWSLIAMLTAGAISAFLALPMPLAIGMVFGAPVLCFLIIEQQVIAASEAWQRRLTLELPVVIEQLGMLLSSGYSLGSALNRLGNRSNGVCGAQLKLVGTRVRQGVTEVQALNEFAALAEVQSLTRLVGVLTLNWEASDLGALIGAEARSVRREVQRGLLETMEKRSQQVWIPVTVATLLPGVIFMAVPFVDAMQKLNGH